MKLATRLSAVAPSATLALTQKAAELRAAGQDVVALTAGEPDFPPPRTATEALKRAVDDGHTRYTPVGGRPEVKAAIVEAYAARGLTYAAQQVVVSTGAKQSIFNAALALLDPGDEAVVLAPYWVSYPDIARIAGANVVTVDTTEADGFVVRPEALDAALTDKARLLFLNSPSNPTGGLYTRADLEAVAEVLRRYPNLVVIADEIYAKFVYGDGGFTSLLDVAPDLQDRTLIIDGCSKAYAMTGLRLGWALGPQPLIAAMTKLQGQSTSNPSAPTQWAAKAVLEGDQSPVARMVEAFDGRRARVVERLRALPGVTCFDPKGAFYAFPSIAGLVGLALPDGTKIRGAQDVCRYLLEDYSVVVVPGEAFGAPTHLRLSYAASDATLNDGLTRMAEALGRIG